MLKWLFRCYILRFGVRLCGNKRGIYTDRGELIFGTHMTMAWRRLSAERSRRAGYKQKCSERMQKVREFVVDESLTIALARNLIFSPFHNLSFGRVNVYMAQCSCCRHQ